jgi:hypothetical protein
MKFGDGSLEFGVNFRTNIGKYKLDRIKNTEFRIQKKEYRIQDTGDRRQKENFRMNYSVFNIRYFKSAP